jgi:hypothetical protein
LASVKVVADAFADLIGRLERLDNNKRFSVLLELLGGSARVALPRKFLAPTSEEVLYQRHDFLTLAGFPNQSNSDSRLAKEICHASQCSASPGF